MYCTGIQSACEASLSDSCGRRRSRRKGHHLQVSDSGERNTKKRREGEEEEEGEEGEIEGKKWERERERGEWREGIMSSKKDTRMRELGKGRVEGEKRNHKDTPVSQSLAPTLPCSLQNIPQFPQGNRMMQVFCKCDEFMAALMEVHVSLIPRLPFF